uniref:Eco57I restriction-modification methylase domain-containing protein n=1 Tax=Microbacterium luticocti TaxID=451764 RepID=UPI000490838B
MQWDAFIVGEEWISEHFFTTDATKQSFQAEVIALRKRWNEEAEDGHETSRSRFLTLRGALAASLATLAESDGSTARDQIYMPLRAALGYDGGGQSVTVNGPVTFIGDAASDTPPTLAVIDAKPVEAIEDLLRKHHDSLWEPYAIDENDTHPLTEVPRLLSSLFVTDDGPTFAVVLAGRWVLVAERERWPEGRYLAIDLQLVADRNDQSRAGEIDRTIACLRADAFIEDAENTIWWTRVLEASRQHAVGVSKDLREGVRRSIEIIANDVVQRRAHLGLTPLPASEADVLGKQALRFLYRILFLLYAEASPELAVLPVGAGEYAEGYSLDRLRELVLVDIAHDDAASRRTHFYDSLSVLFRMVDRGNGEPLATDGSLPEGLIFNPLKADLFRPQATALIDEVGLGDRAMQRVLEHLLLTKQSKKSDRGFISYGELGINQLGAVYEGLMSYTGFFAEEDMYEVAKDGDSSKGSWVVPVERSRGLADKDFVKTDDAVTGMPKPVLHARGSFVFRLAGRERQQSASYYTPEVLTRFVVSQALEELLDQDGHTTTADEILQLTVCEPALGSGAFAIEATRQLADEYLSRKQRELGKKIDPERYAAELQRAKASIALHQVYGVDLNATAVELAEISLWLDTMVAGLSAPWFGLHLRRGNSLIGARRATFSRHQLESRTWLGDVPTDVPLGDDTHGGIHHFLVPAPGWGAAVDAKEAKTLAPEARIALNTWAKSIKRKPTKRQLDRLGTLARRVETLWSFALRRRQIAEREARREIRLWGQPEHEGDHAGPQPVQRDEIERTLAAPDSAYQRLRRVMDAWCAMWFWPLTDELVDGAVPPSLDEWIEGLTLLLGEHTEARSRSKFAATELELPSEWHALTTAEEIDLSLANAPAVREVLESTPWLRATERIAARHGFFHWELDFAHIFADNGGFDLQVGNPPWVRPRSDVDALLAEADPWWQLKSKSTAAQDREHREFALSIAGMRDLVVDGTTDVACTAAYLGSVAQYPHLVGLQPDLYRCFMEQTWRHAGPTGSVGLIHPETHFTDEKAGRLRRATYRRLRRHWAFVNELTLFDEVHHLVNYGIHVYGASRHPDFLQASSLYHPDTAVRSLSLLRSEHDGSGAEPGLKDEEGRWDLRPHASRIQHVDEDTLRTWHAILETDDVPIAQTRMVYTVNKSTAAVLSKLAAAPRIGSLGLQFSAGWHETNDRAKGYFDVEWGVPESWDQV